MSLVHAWSIQIACIGCAALLCPFYLRMHPDCSQPAAYGRALPPGENESASAIVVGFLGGFVRADEVHRPEAQLIDRLRTSYGDKVCAGIFENRQIRKAHDLIRECLDQDKSGELSGNEKRQTTIILFGHSWGASAAVTLARKLQQDGIPVSLTVQVDNISKHGEDDSIIPPNVAEAANFYQTGGILHGSRIRAANPLSTVIISNTRLRYEVQFLHAAHTRGMSASWPKAIMQSNVIRACGCRSKH